MAISEFCCSLHVPNITSHLAIEGVCLLLHTKFRKSETWSSEVSYVTSRIVPTHHSVGGRQFYGIGRYAVPTVFTTHNFDRSSPDCSSPDIPKLFAVDSNGLPGVATRSINSADSATVITMHKSFQWWPDMFNGRLLIICPVISTVSPVRAIMMHYHG